jgi:hypothetical protein
MQVSKREKNIIVLAGIVALVFVATQILPAIQSIYGERQEAIEAVLLSSDQELRLVENAERWQQRRANVETERATLEQQVFSGATVPLIEANIQSALAQYARDADIERNSTRLAERLEADGWLLISQEMSFRTNDAANTLRLLEALENSSPRLYVKDFTLNRNRNLFTGDITVVGFARSDQLTTPSAQARR